MSDSQILAAEPLERLAEQRTRVAAIRGRAMRLFDGGATGIQVAAGISEATDEFLVELFEQAVAAFPADKQPLIRQHSAMIAVGGTGRGELAPYSDVDLLFLYRSPAKQPFAECVAQMVRDCWDAHIKLGHSLRTLNETFSLARQEANVATAVMESRLLWGDEELFEQLEQQFRKRVIRGRLNTLVDACIEARRVERDEHGATICELEPDVKRSLGGLRDLHLIRWIGSAVYGTADIDSLRLQGVLSKDDARGLLKAQEFITRVRCDLHFSAGKEQDRLSRDEQLRIAEERKVEAPAGRRPVECFMQEYFRHSTAIAAIAQRFATLHQRKPLLPRMLGFLMSHRADGIFRVGGDWIDVFPADRQAVCSQLEQVLRLYHSAALYGVTPAPHLVERIKAAQPEMSGELSPQAASQFLMMMGRNGHLGALLRSLYRVGVLEMVIPNMEYTRGLLQFNQYHSYTVDEHTLRAIEAVESFAGEDSPVGAVYREIRHKEILHLAILLHDLGKGFDEDHSDVGKVIAGTIAQRLHLPDHQRDVLVFLVYKHLQMTHLAFRRDITDPEVLLQFSREVGSPETLRMLYVLTAADLTAVGPGVWTSWKAELLADLFGRTMLILDGKHPRFQEEERLQYVRKLVRSSTSLAAAGDDGSSGRSLDARLDDFPPHYLLETPPERIAADLSIIHRLQPDEVVIEGRFDEENGTFEYRIIADERSRTGLFHKIAGALTAKHLEVLAADISTNRDRIVVDSFRVHDHEFAGEAPAERIDEVIRTIRDVLDKRVTVDETYRRHKRFSTAASTEPVSDLPMRVVVDNDSSDRCTVIDVFAHDRPGLLYTISRAIFKLGLSVMLAKISTHLDQIVDVFYVTNMQGDKIKDGQKLTSIRDELTARIAEFEREGHEAIYS